MVGKLGLLVLLTVALALPFVSGSPLGADTHVVAREVPGAGFQFVPPDLVVDVEGTLTLTNADLAGHDVVAVENGPETNPWCERFTTRACPLFASPIAGLGQQTQVEGLDALPPSDPYAGTTTYFFYCSVHPWMTGTLTTI